MKRILGAGISSTLYRIIFGVQSQLISITGFQNINIPGLSQVPVIGPVISQMPMVYIGFTLVPIISYSCSARPPG